MKQGTVLNRIVMILLFLAILLYMGGAVWRSLHMPYPTVQAYQERVDESLKATGFLVRQEQVIEDPGGIVDLIPGEGEKVERGGKLAVLYADASSVDRAARVEELRRDVVQMKLALDTASQPAAYPSQNVVDAMVGLRSAVASGDMTQLERHTAEYKSAVIQQTLRQGSTADLKASLDRVQGELSALESQTAHDVGQIYSSSSGIFSSQVDGYESLLTPGILEGLTPSVLDSIPQKGSGLANSGLCKLITDSQWYFICTIPEEETTHIHEGDMVTVRFSRDWSGDVAMRVERISAPEDGRVALTLTSSRFLSNTTLLRRQTVDLVLSSAQGLRVPAAAVRMDEDGVTGVFVQVGITAEFKPVEVLAQGEDYYLVKPSLPEVADQRDKKKALRAGDQVIVAREEIWDGKVLIP